MYEAIPTFTRVNERTVLLLPGSLHAHSYSGQGLLGLRVSQSLFPCLREEMVDI